MFTRLVQPHTVLPAIERCSVAWPQAQVLVLCKERVGKASGDASGCGRGPALGCKAVLYSVLVDLTEFFDSKPAPSLLQRYLENSVTPLG
jgi:hypothetical protein